MAPGPRLPARPRTFRSAAAFSAWLGRRHDRAAELLVRCFKVHARGEGLTYREALDEALCWGWIDGVRRAVDAQSFSVRFGPRKARSAWSAVNTRRAKELIAEGRMQPPGLAAFRAGVASRYSYESRRSGLSAAYQRRFRRVPGAWADYQARPPWYRRTSAHWVMSAKREETRERRLQQLIDFSARGELIPPLARPPRS